MLTAHTAPVVLTMTGAPQLQAAVLVDGDRIVSVGPAVALPAGVRVRTHRGVLTPGLVNAHTHLEYGPRFADLATTGLALGEWIRGLTSRRQGMTEADWLVQARGSVHAVLRSGTTCVADVVTIGPGLRAATLVGLAGVSYLEVVGADDAAWPAERLRVASLLAGTTGRVLGVSPPALSTLSSHAFQEAVGLVRARGLRLHPHLAETAEEAELADALGALGPDVHVAHGVHLSASDRQLLRARGTAVALCTRSNAVLHAGQAPVADYLAEGSPLALGTDSLASSPDLDLLAEARATRDLALQQGAAPEGLAEALIRAATVGGAAAMGLVGAAGRGAGTLVAGGRADLAVFDVPTSGDPYAALVEHGAARCTATVVAGRLLHRMR